MDLSNNTQAMLLLTAYFSKPEKGAAKPLTITEWGRFALWLKDKGQAPANLLAADQQEILKQWHDNKITSERITALLARGYALALALEKWQRAGLWVITRSDEEYPQRLKQRLRNDAPPVLFGCGNKDLLNGGGIAVVGSRNVGETDLSFTEGLGHQAATSGVGIVSGGARGVDETAMLSAMHSAGNVVGIMADSLLKAATSAKWRNGLMAGNIVLISPFYPEAGFNAGNAMARNKYIYCLADAAIVVHSGIKGGTWNGANENLKKQWVPLWIKPTDDVAAGNVELVAQGGQWCSADFRALQFESLCVLTPRAVDAQNDFFAANGNPSDIESHLKKEVIEDTLGATKPLFGEVPTDFYAMFLHEIQRLAQEPITVDEVATALGLHKSQVNDWLIHAVNSGKLLKLAKPVRYQWKKGTNNNI